MSKNLFDNFSEISAKQWKQKIQMDLKGADYNNTLISKTNTGIDIKPFYHNDGFKRLNIPSFDLDALICQTIFIDNEKKANNIAKDAIKRGANTIRFIAKKTFDYNKLLLDFPKTNIKIYLKFHFLDTKFINELINLTKDYKIYFNIDSIGNFTKNGNWFTNQLEDFNTLKKLITTQVNYSFIGVEVGLYQNAGANIVQQVAYALAHVSEYLNGDLILKHTTVQFTFSVGSNYFFEIAKLRAFRYLFAKLIEEHNLDCEIDILVEPSLRNKTLYDYNINMLRTTTECMSAFLGGANVISNVAYDTIYHKSNEFGERISRNQLLILQEESYYKNAQEIAKSSYYIEELTYEIANKSLILFKDIEKNGGFIKQLEKGTIQRKIEESAQKEQKQFNNKELILVGTNKYLNEEDKMKNDLELFPFVKTNIRKTLIKPIIPKRLAEKFEQERLKNE